MNEVPWSLSTIPEGPVPDGLSSRGWRQQKLWAGLTPYSEDRGRKIRKSAGNRYPAEDKTRGKKKYGKELGQGLGKEQSWLLRLLISQKLLGTGFIRALIPCVSSTLITWILLNIKCIVSPNTRGNSAIRCGIKLLSNTRLRSKESHFTKIWSPTSVQSNLQESS